MTILIEKPRIKLYTNSQGQRNGEGLVTYLRPESVALAIDLLDNTEYRPGVEKGRIRVQQVTLFFCSLDQFDIWPRALINVETDVLFVVLFYAKYRHSSRRRSGRRRQRGWRTSARRRFRRSTKSWKRNWTGLMMRTWSRQTSGTRCAFSSTCSPCRNSKPIRHCC